MRLIKFLLFQVDASSNIKEGFRSIIAIAQDKTNSKLQNYS
jgi:hypothetical protein